jgi:hypothetical protein
MRRIAIFIAGSVLGLLALPVPAAQAAAGVSVDAGGQGAVIDSTYSTQLSVSGNGFQSIKGGHGGIYVWFGTVSPGWQPSKGGKSGVDYAYVPDTEDKSNKGFQQFVSFPGSDTASSAAATMSADGRWSVRLTVPGPSFQAVGRNGSVRTVDCRKVTCGVITVGAHGVRNANNETFTPVGVADLHGADEPSPQQPSPQTGDEPDQDVRPGGSSQTTTPGDGQGPGTAPRRAQGRRGPVRLEVDRVSAVAGRAVSWTGTNLRPGRQFTVVLDDGLAASGPHSAGADGRASGVILLPADLPEGTHELRLFSAGRKGSVKFGTSGSGAAGTAASAEPGSERRDEVAVAFAIGSGAVFLAALGFAARRMVGGRRA